MKKTMVVMFLLALAGCTKEAPQKAADVPATSVTQQQTKPEAQPTKPRLKPETFVQFPKSAIACLKKQDLAEVTMHYLRGEKTKASSYFDSDNERCVMINSELTYKILSVQYGTDELVDIGIMEVVRKDIKSANGVWVYTMVAKPIDVD